MLPANLAKTRATGRGTYGELVVLSGSAGTVGTAAGSTANLSHLAGLSSAAAAASNSASSASVVTNSLRYSPYPVPSALVGHPHHHHHHQQQQHVSAAQQQQTQAILTAAAAAHLLPFATQSTTTPAHILQYAATSATNPFLEAAAAAVSYKRLLAAATVASMRPHSHMHSHLHQTTRAAAASTQLSYPLGDLLNVPSLDVSSLYSSAAAAASLGIWPNPGAAAGTPSPFLAHLPRPQ